MTDPKLPVLSEFPEMKNDLVLKVIRGEKTDRIPIWIMRQAGRYLPEFQEIRKKHDFFKICRTPELAAQVTLMPIQRFAFDAAIIFSDIMVVPQALGMQVEMNPGPTFPHPLTIENHQQLEFKDCAERLKYVGQAIALTRQQLQGSAVMFGFAGAPWTLLSYMIEGGGSKTYTNAKKWLYNHSDLSHQLLENLAVAVADFCVLQVQYGAQVVQIFDTNAEQLDWRLYEEFCVPVLGLVRSRVRSRLNELNIDDVPMVLFSKGTFHSIDKLAKLGYEVLSLDPQIKPEHLNLLLSDTSSICFQGNLDPVALFGPKDKLKELVLSMLKSFTSFRHIVNLGHGILPETPLENVAAFINTVRSYGAK